MEKLKGGTRTDPTLTDKRVVAGAATLACGRLIAAGAKTASANVRPSRRELLGNGIGNGRVLKGFHDGRMGVDGGASRRSDAELRSTETW